MSDYSERFAALHEKLGDKNIYEHLGVKPDAPLKQMHEAYRHMREAAQQTVPKRERSNVILADTSEALAIMEDSQLRQHYDQWLNNLEKETKAALSQVTAPVRKPAPNTTPITQAVEKEAPFLEYLSKLSIRDPKVALCAAAAVTVGTFIGINATQRIKLAKSEEDGKASFVDQVKQAAGFAGATAVIAAAALMWNNPAAKGR